MEEMRRKGDGDTERAGGVGSKGWVCKVPRSLGEGKRTGRLRVHWTNGVEAGSKDSSHSDGV